MPTFTAMHRELGLPPGDVTDELIDAAVSAEVAETDDLDWKGELPPTSNLGDTDFPKDLAAMANYGGGVIVYGVSENQKKATGRVDVGELTEIHERTLRAAAVSCIRPPMFGLGVHRVGVEGKRAVAIVVPPSVDGPHLIFKKDYFGAPIRNNADTVWMAEREIAAQYRARFEAERHASEVLDTLYTQTAAGVDSEARAWLIAVAHPRAAVNPLTRWAREDARALLTQAIDYSLSFAKNLGPRPFGSVDWQNPRPGLRRWTAVNKMTGEGNRCLAATLGVHFDGSVNLAMAVGGHRRSYGGIGEARPVYGGHLISESVVEGAVADLMGLIRSVGESIGAVEYEVRVGIEWGGDAPLSLYYQSQGFDEDAGTVPMHRFAPVQSLVEIRAGDDAGSLRQVQELALDCVNQGGVEWLRLIPHPEL